MYGNLFAGCWFHENHYVTWEKGSVQKRIDSKNYWKLKRRLCVELFEVTNTTWENLQIATHKSVSFTPHIVLICVCNLQIFSGCVCHLGQLHTQSPFLFPIVFSLNLITFFDICSVDLLAVFQPGCPGMCYFTSAAARSQQLLFVVLAAGLWCLIAGCHVKSPLFPQPPLKHKCAPRSRWEKAYMRKHTNK